MASCQCSRSNSCDTFTTQPRSSADAVMLHQAKLCMLWAPVCFQTQLACAYGVMLDMPTRSQMSKGSLPSLQRVLAHSTDLQQKWLLCLLWQWCWAKLHPRRTLKQRPVQVLIVCFTSGLRSMLNKREEDCMWLHDFYMSSQPQHVLLC